MVVIRSSTAYLERFINLIKSKKPQVVVISDITFTQINDKLEFEGFKILPSKFIDGQITRVSADIATCKDCLEDFKNQKLRINYPLINCTNCGPRFSIVKKIPYDRCNTTMNNFTMCPNCKHEYNNPLDRRFHAQPISCNLCGPKFRGFFSNAVKEDATNNTSILNNNINVLKKGGVVAMKRRGGYVWIVDALNENAVKKLREVNRRYVENCASVSNGLDWIGE